MKVQDIMTGRAPVPHTERHGSRGRAAHEGNQRRRHSGRRVRVSKKLVGVVTDRDIAIRVVADGQEARTAAFPT